MITAGSLFAGIGGFDYGFQAAGIDTIWQVEIDKFCRGVLKHHYPNAKQFNDIRECGAHSLERVDIISGGFPCQDISVAGRKAGITGEKSGLWSEMFRVCGELRPRFIVIENVRNLVNLGLDRVLADLASIGYDAEWTVISASEIGAWHRRERIWIVAYPQKTECERSGYSRQGGAGFTDLCQDVSDPSSERNRYVRESIRNKRSKLHSEGRQGVGNEPYDICEDETYYRWQDGEIEFSDSDPERQSQSEGIVEKQRGRIIDRSQVFEQSDDGKFKYWESEPDVGRLADGIPDRVSKLRALGNAVVPQIPYLIGRRLKEIIDSERK